MNDWQKRRVLDEARATIDRLRDMPEPPPRADDGERDVLLRWVAGMPKPEKSGDVANLATRTDAKEVERPSAPPIDWASVTSAIDERIEAEHAFMIEVMVTALGESLLASRKQSAAELAAEVRKLWAVLTEMQVTLSALARIGVTNKAGEVLDLPALPRARDLN